MSNNKKKIVSLVLALVLFLPFAAVNVKAEGENVAEPAAEETNEEVETFYFGARISFANYSGVQYESLAKENALYKSVIGAVITMTNQETGQVFTYTTDETGSHQRVQAGKYLMELKSVPDDILGRFEWPEAKMVEVSGSSFNGFNVVESKKKDSEVYKPEVKEIEVPQYGDLNPEDGIANLKELPEGTKVEDITPEELNTRKPGKYTRTLKVTYPDMTSTEVEVTVYVTVWFGARISFRNLPENEYECLEKTDTPYKSVIGAVITLTNQETGKVYTYTTDETGSHQRVQAGKYLMELKSVPEELKDRFEWPEAKEVEVTGSSFNGFNVVEIKVEDETEPTTTPETKPSTEATTEKPTSPSMSDKATKPSKTEAKNVNKTAKTGDTSYIALATGLLSLAIAGALLVNRKRDEE